MYIVEEKFNLSVEYCSNIENHTNEDIYGEVEKEVDIQYTLKRTQASL